MIRWILRRTEAHRCRLRLIEVVQNVLREVDGGDERNQNRLLSVSEIDQANVIDEWVVGEVPRVVLRVKLDVIDVGDVRKPRNGTSIPIDLSKGRGNAVGTHNALTCLEFFV